MFQINVEDPKGTIEGALTALGCKAVELADKIGTSSAQLSRAKKAERLPAALESKFRAYLDSHDGSAASQAPDTDPSANTDNTALVPATPVRTTWVPGLEIDHEIQQRATHVDPGTVARYVEVVKRNIENKLDSPWPFPAVTVFEDEGGPYWLADGFHRAEAANQLGIERIPADIRKGSRRDALLYAVGANDEESLPRTVADKTRSVRTMLEDPEWSQWSDREIARQCKVSHTFVAKIRTGSDSSQIDTALTKTDIDAIREAVKKPLPQKRKTKSGHAINVAGISKSNKARAKAPATPAKSPQKHAQEALIKFGGVCADLRKGEAHLTESEIRTIATHCRDQLIWTMRSLPTKDITAFVAKIEEAAKEVA